MLKSTVVYNHPSILTIYVNKFVQYLRVGWMLHIASIASIGIFVGALNKVLAQTQIEFDLTFFLWCFVMSFGCTNFVISAIDGYGRFQNYKQTKDLFHKYGFDTRLLRPFTGSRCQRNAVMEAARTTNNKEQTKAYFKALGYKWYHIFPVAFVKNPLVLFTKIFWKRILVTKYYKLLYFYW